MADLIEPERLRAAFITSPGPWQGVEHHAKTTSTNARALELGRPWQVVVADHQTAGRGRLARAWDSPPGASLLLTATVPLPPSGGGWLPLLTGLAVQRAVAATTSVVGVLKWPNDLLLPADGDRKVCGILCEIGSGSAGSADRVIAVGVGLNVAQGRDDLPVPTATSLRLAGGEAAGSTDRTTLALAVLEHLGRTYAALVAGGSAAAQERAAYRDGCSTLGQEVRLSRVAADDVVGTAVAVDDEGRLVLDVAGERSAWAAGDVVHARPAG